MKDIGKIVGAYFYGLGLVSFVSMLYILSTQKQSNVELTWICFWIFGLLMCKHSNPARYIVIGFNFLAVLLLPAVLIGTGGSPSDSSALTIFSIEIQNATTSQLWAFTALFILSSLAVIILLMTPKAKEEFSTRRIEPVVKTPFN